MITIDVSYTILDTLSDAVPIQNTVQATSKRSRSISAMVIATINIAQLAAIIYLLWANL